MANNIGPKLREKVKEGLKKDEMFQNKMYQLAQYYYNRQQVPKKDLDSFMNQFISSSGFRGEINNLIKKETRLEMMSTFTEALKIVEAQIQVQQHENKRISVMDINFIPEPADELRTPTSEQDETRIQKGKVQQQKKAEEARAVQQTNQLYFLGAINEYNMGMQNVGNLADVLCPEMKISKTQFIENFVKSSGFRAEVKGLINQKFEQQQKKDPFFSMSNEESRNILKLGLNYHAAIEHFINGNHLASEIKGEDIKSDFQGISTTELIGVKSVDEVMNRFKPEFQNNVIDAEVEYFKSLGHNVSKEDVKKAFEKGNMGYLPGVTREDIVGQTSLSKQFKEARKTYLAAKELDTVIKNYQTVGELDLNSINSVFNVSNKIHQEIASIYHRSGPNFAKRAESFENAAKEAQYTLTACSVTLYACGMVATAGGLGAATTSLLGMQTTASAAVTGLNITFNVGLAMADWGYTKDDLVMGISTSDALSITFGAFGMPGSGVFKQQAISWLGDIVSTGINASQPQLQELYHKLDGDAKNYMITFARTIQDWWTLNPVGDENRPFPYSGQEQLAR